MRLGKTKLKIIEAANTLFYQQGYEHTALSQIANEVGISKGNFYHHYKTKDDILEAVLNQRLVMVEEALVSWETEHKQPELRIRSFIQSAVATQSQTQKFGCPIGSLTAELNKLTHPSQSEMKRFFALFRNWLSKQFEELGFQSKADQYAVHLITQTQGAALLAQTFEDESIVTQQAERMESWLSELIERKTS
ncbi:TetR/AcrR family transcriptional regulator [Vibrio nigripulchritudo]|uniref:TetR/AcrR family transcriptional regulator n=1 Tax=Vibrio nigripulchritudo TaxID=28173 RepID=UPI0003B1F932|nr:TetR/AcrR family transcriptional regulator [Vibrio nigripulchritudo]CCN69546.1 putative Transcriptional regulator, TetR-like [Vibrio nigripulchritudo SFn118]